MDFRRLVETKLFSGSLFLIGVVYGEGRDLFYVFSHLSQYKPPCLFRFKSNSETVAIW